MKPEEKLKKIESLIEQRNKINEELKSLVSDNMPGHKVPANFSLNDEVLEIVEGSGESGIAVPDIKEAILGKFPNYGLNRVKISSTLAYLKNTKHSIDKGEGRAVYISTKYTESVDDQEKEAPVEPSSESG